MALMPVIGCTVAVLLLLSLRRIGLEGRNDDSLGDGPGPDEPGPPGPPLLNLPPDPPLGAIRARRTAGRQRTPV